MLRRKLSVFLSLYVVLAAGATAASAQVPSAPEPVREITSIRGDLYQVHVANQFTVFLVTPEGIVLADPLTVAAAKWLKSELDTRFPDRPVRYVLESHHHFDRAAGASLFTATAEVVGHREFNPQLSEKRRSSNSFKDVIDVERSYDGRRSIVLGGRTVEMLYTGPGHSADMSALYFPSERAVFAVDHPAVLSTPLSFGPFAAREVLAWLRAMAPLDIELFISGEQGGTPAVDLKTVLQYVEELVSGVETDFQEGMSLAQIQSGPLLTGNQGGPQYGGRDAQIAQVYRGLRLWSMTASASALTNHVSRNGAGYCERTTACSPVGGATSAINFAVGANLNRLGALAELRIGRQLAASRTSPLYDDEFAYRETVLAGLFRFRAVTGKPLSVAVLGGPVMVISDLKGLDRVKDGRAPFAGRHPFGYHTTNVGLAGGADIEIRTGRRFSVHGPVRLTRVVRDVVERTAGSLDFQVGIGIGLLLGQRVRSLPGRTPPIVTTSDR